MKVHFRVVDLETNDMDPPEEIIEVGYTDTIFDSETKALEIGDTCSLLFKPVAPLKIDAQAVHHITDEDLVGCAPFTDADGRLLLSGEPWALIAHQAEFERKWLTDEMLGNIRWIDTYKVALRLWPEAPGHSLQKLRYFLKLPVDRERAMPPHRAGPDTYVTAHLFAECVKLATVQQMDLWTRSPRYYHVCPLKKHKGQAWSDIPADYLKWVIGPNDVEADVKAAAQAELDRRHTAS